MNWLVERPQESFRCEVKARYQQQSRPSTVRLNADGTASITLDEPLNGVAPGQAAVLYHGDQALGGGWIMSPEPSPQNAVAT